MGSLFSFSGRVGRSAVWGTFVAGIALYAAFFAWQASLAPYEQIQVYSNYYTGESQIYWGTEQTKTILLLFAAAWVVLLFINFSVSVRRWHDHDKSGWWSLIAIVPVVGSLYSLAMLAFVPGTPTPNRYGPPIA